LAILRPEWYIIHIHLMTDPEKKRFPKSPDPQTNIMNYYQFNKYSRTEKWKKE